MTHDGCSAPWCIGGEMAIWYPDEPICGAWAKLPENRGIARKMRRVRKLSAQSPRPEPGMPDYPGIADRYFTRADFERIRAIRRGFRGGHDPDEAVA